jgi:hypothetical protein
VNEPVALSLLYERAGLPAFDLPAAIRLLYDGDLGFPERCLFANFVSTIDGVVAIPSLRRSNRLISDDSEADRFVMGLLRACADVVLVGSGTLVGSPDARWRPGGAYPPAAVAFRSCAGRSGGAKSRRWQSSAPAARSIPAIPCCKTEPSS